MSQPDSQDGFSALFAQEPNTPAIAVADDASATWKILLVDDESDIHALFRLALHGVVMEERPLQLFGAGSAEEAKVILSEHPEMALVLLDVVMETEQAGLVLAHYIRQTLDNRQIQIVLVTGQPGYAPQRRVVTEYKINGYQIKSELTADKIFSTVYMAIRTHHAMLELSHQIAECKLIEKELSRANAYNRSLIEVSLDPMVTITSDGVITDVNSATEAVTGWPRNALIGAEFSECFTEPILAKAGYQLAFQTGSVRNFALTMRHRNGHQTPVLYNASVYKDEAGNVVGVFAAARDITERKRVEDELRKSEARLDFALKNSSIGAWEMNLSDNFTQRTLIHDQIYGYQALLPIWTYTMFLEHVLPEDRQRVDRTFHEACAAKTDWSFEFRIRRPDGEVRWIYAAGGHVKNSEGDPVCVSGIVQDITDRKHIEIALKESEARLALATLHNGVGVWDWNLRTSKMIWDDSMYRLYHIREEDFSGTVDTWAKSLHTDDREHAQKQLQAALSGKKPFNTEFRVRWPNGAVRHIKAVATVFHDENGKPVRMLGTNIDITDRKEAENELLASRAKLKAALSSMTDAVFISDASGRIIEFNDAFITFHKIKKEGESVKTDVFMTNGELARPDQWVISRALQGEIEKNAEYTLRRKETGETWVGSYSFAPIRNEHGLIVGSVVTARDVTDYKQAMKMLQESEKRYRLLADTMSRGVIYRNAVGQIISMNPAAEIILGRSHKELIADNSPAFEEFGAIREDGSPLPGKEHPACLALRTGKKVLGTVIGIFNPRSNEYRWINMDTVPVFCPDEGSPSEVYSVFDDITEPKRAAAALRARFYTA